MNTNGMITLSQAQAICDLMGQVSAQPKVRWVLDGVERCGEIRKIVPDGDNFLDAHVWVSTGVTEISLPVSAVIQLIANHEWVPNTYHDC